MKLKKGDVIEDNNGKRGEVHSVQGDLIGVKLSGNSYVQTVWISDLTKIEPPNVGDLVRVISYGKWQAQEGHVIQVVPCPSSGGDPLYTVELDEPIDFDAIDLKVIKRLPKTPEKVVREEGKQIKPEHVQKGDEIEIFIDHGTIKGVSETTRNTGVFDFRNSYGTLFTADYGVLMNAHQASKSVSTIITLLKKGEDPITATLRELSNGSVISWIPNGKGKKVKVALKISHKYWNTMTSSTSGTVTDDAIRRYISDAGDTYEILKEGNK